MRWMDRGLLAGTCLAACLTIGTAFIATPQAVRIALAVLIVFMLPGVAAVGAVIPAGRVSSGERLVASLGISVATATCVAVLLGATPVGLSQKSFAVALGASTATMSIVALLRSFAVFHWRSGHERKGRQHTEGT
jgi:uncharacterized membrane protein